MKWSTADPDRRVPHVYFHYLLDDDGWSLGYVIEDRRCVPTKFRAVHNNSSQGPAHPSTTTLEESKALMLAQIVANKLEGTA